MGFGGSFGDALQYEKLGLSEMWKKIKEDPERLFIGAADPFSSDLWGGILGKDYDPIINQWGGQPSDLDEKARAKGIDPSAGRGAHDIAQSIAQVYAGNYFGGGGGGGGGGEGKGFDLQGLLSSPPGGQAQAAPAAPMVQAQGPAQTRGSGMRGFDVAGLLENPMVQMGVGLLEANNAGYGQDSNPYSGALRGASRAGRAKDERISREAFEAEQARVKKLQDELQRVYGSQPPIGPQMSPVPQRPSPFVLPSQGVPGQTPGINPHAPPIGGTPGPFGPALISAGAPIGGQGAAPTTEQINAIMLQYGSPQQQQAALTQMGTGERFRAGLAAEEARFTRAQDPRNKIGQYNPRDYTSSSWARFSASGDPADLQRYERIRTYTDADGLTRTYDAVSGQDLGGFQSVETVASNKKEINQAAAQGTAQGSAITQAQQDLAKADNTAKQLERLMADDNFSQSVGFIDNITGRIGEKFGSDQGVLGGEVTRVANQLVTEAVSSWKGAISERELQFFQDSVPGRGSSASTWRSWYQNEYLPRKQIVEQIASGQVFGNNPAARAGGTVNGVEWSLEE